MASGIIEPSQSGGSQEQEQEKQRQQAQNSGITRNKLVHKLLQHGNNLPAFVSDLITTQAVVVAGTEACGFLLEQGDEPGSVRLKTVAHIRPDNSPEDVRKQALQAFTEIVSPCIEQQKNGAIMIEGTDSGAEPQFCLVTLLRNEGQTVACSAVITRCRNQDAAQQRLMSMELVAGYFDLYMMRRKLDQSAEISRRNQDVLQYGSSVATAEGFESAAMNLCNELATRTGAARVSIGWVKGDKIKLKAMSHTEQFDRKQELSVTIEKVMEECWDQEDNVIFDPDGVSSQNVSREAQQLARINGGETVMSLPLRNRGEVVGVMTLEYARDKKLLPHDATALAVSVELLAPQMFDRYQNDRWWITKTGIAIVDTYKLAVGPKHALAKLITFLVIAVLVTVFVYKPMYHVSAPFQFDVVHKRTISAPYQGVIETVFKKPGDAVKAGEPLLQLKTFDLMNQKIESLQRAAKADAEAQADLNPPPGQGPPKEAEAQAAMHERDAAMAEANHIQWQIGQATITSPIDGVVLMGDLEDKQDATVKLGDPLMEVGKPDDLRAAITMDEKDIQMVKVLAHGKIATSALPTVKNDIIVDSIDPKGEPKEGSNTFKIYAKFPGNISKDWRPGMQGEANIDTEPKPLIWFATHRLFDWVRLKAWGWF